MVFSTSLTFGLCLSAPYSVSDIVPRRIVGIDGGASVREAAQCMLRENRGDLIVTIDSHPEGMVTERDIARKVVARGLHASDVKVASIMTEPLITVPASYSLDQAIELMARKRVRRLAVEEGNAVVGVITERDILNVFQTCGNCHQVILLIPTRGKEPGGFLTCSCNTRYHRTCAEQIVHCLHCGSTLVAEIEYPPPEETTGG